MVFCESCYDPDYLKYWELVLIKNEKSKIEINNTLFIYNYEDFTQIFDDLLYLFTSENQDNWMRCNRDRYLMYNTPEQTSISEKSKIELIKTMYSGIKDHYCETQQNEFKVGPHPNELPIPKTLFSNR